MVFCLNIDHKRSENEGVCSLRKVIRSGLLLVNGHFYTIGIVSTAFMGQRPDDCILKRVKYGYKY